MQSTTASGTRKRRLPLVDTANFLLATRDSGYRSTSHAIAEFVDNSIQAGATSVAIDVRREAGPFPVELLITDNGSGMDEETLASALAFGGSTRFGDRSSLGRYGMGLPNGALSCARRVEVYTWKQGRVLAARLDIDEIVNGGLRSLHPVEVIARPTFLPSTRNGTAVLLRRCDRLEYRRATTISRRLHDDLGRIYRRYIDRGMKLTVAGVAVACHDPMLRGLRGGRADARRFGEPLVYNLECDGRAGSVVVTFAELPVERWHALPAEEKRRLGVTGAPPVSIMRADREIDRGWFFMGGKRRENYDDWWRCEIEFDPVLDELFGITNSKQGISPHPDLASALEGDLESVARALNQRVRQKFEFAKATKSLNEAERQAARADSALPPLPRRREALPEQVCDLLKTLDVVTSGSGYRIVVSDLPSTIGFEVVHMSGQLVVIFNAGHPLYRDLYGPLAMSDSEKDQDTARRIALAVLAAARAEASTSQRDRAQIRRFRHSWADVLATFFNA